MKKIALALGSGGARGYAHIGVIRELEARDYEIVAISGTSMGALVGGLYCTGAMEEYAEWVCSLDYLGVLKLLDVTWDKAGAIRGERVMQAMRELMGDVNIQDLDIPYAAVAADLNRQKEVWFQNGSLDMAIRASISMPGVFTPVSNKNAYLVDGGILNPVPVSPLQAAHDADLVMAVNVTSDINNVSIEQLLPDYFAKKDKNEKQDRPAQRLVDDIRNRASGFIERISWWDEAESSEQQRAMARTRNWGKLDMVMQSFDVTQASLARYKLAGSPPDIQIDIGKQTISTFDFHRAEPMIELGERLARRALDEYERTPEVKA
ncbi:patatin-like phospholipase family protein [Salinibius halmophilus]|uniref:patatin-like phospholipase family protein n=1 Tax=Salinibius halmophilus TaxID=1853216 RepID=UPI000E66B77E|nr:patatin-like phospholipase family protein [Salinibius halmophilus]